MKQYFSLAKTFILSLLLFAFPLFFLPTTQEFFVTNKLYLLAFAVLALLLVSTLELLVTKKMVWYAKPFDNMVVLFVFAVVLSIVISSPNKIEALVNTNFGLVGIVSLAILYFYLSRSSRVLSSLILNLSSLILALTTIVFFFQPFKSLKLPTTLQFLKSPGFNLFGNQLDVAIWLGFFVVYGLTQILKEQKNPTDRKSILNFSFLIVNLVALSLTLYSILKPMVSSQQSLLLAPFSISWYAAVETLKSPLTALFGTGVDNFASMFTRVKDVTYNQSSLWQINSFSLSRSAILHIFTETGLFGIIAFGLLVFAAIKKAIAAKHLSSEMVGFGFVLLMMVLFPPSLALLFLLFVTLSQLVVHETNHSEKSFDMGEIIPLYLGFVVLSLVLIGGMGYFLGRSYVSEYYFKKSVDGYAANNVKDVYDNQRQAIILNPYIERFRVNFAQTNLIIANNVASKANPPEGKTSGDQKTPQLSDQDKQTVSQAIQAAIAEAKAAVSLNQQKAANWENLAVIYRNILTVAQGADTWTISAYQRAIVLDPQNPIYRLNLGGVYYQLQKWDEAVNLFSQSTSLKPDWANAHYNLAWASYQKGDYQQAAAEMQNAVNLLDPKASKDDYAKAQKELEDFKKKLPKSEGEATQSSQLNEQKQLSLPTPPPAKIEPKINLPKNASPEAK